MWYALVALLILSVGLTLASWIDSPAIVTVTDREKWYAHWFIPNGIAAGIAVFLARSQRSRTSLRSAEAKTSALS